MPPFRRGTKPDSHLLDDVGHQECKRDEGQKESDAEGRTRRRVGNHAGPVVFPEHDEDAGTDQQPEKAQRTVWPLAGPQEVDPPTIMGPFDIFDRDLWCGIERLIHKIAVPYLVSNERFITA